MLSPAGRTFLPVGSMYKGPAIETKLASWGTEKVTAAEAEKGRGRMKVDDVSIGKSDHVGSFLKHFFLY